MRSNNKAAAQREPDDLLVLERLREEGDYAALAELLTDDWQNWNVFDERTIRIRLLAAEVLDQQGDIEGVRRALEPYINASERAPFVVADRLFVALAAYKHSAGEPVEALQLIEFAQALLHLRKNTFLFGEAVQLQADVLCTLGRLDQAITSFRQAATSHTDHGRRYRCGIVSVSLGEVLFRAGKLTEARAALEEADKLLVASRDRFALASAREALATVQSVMGHHHEALKNLAQAAGIYEDLGRDSDLAIALAKTALVFHLIKRRSEAAAYQSHALIAAARTKIESYCGFQELMAQAYLEASDLQKAEAFVRLAVENARSSGTSLEQAEVERTAGRLYLLQEKHPEAILSLRSALGHVLDAQQKVLELEIKALLALGSVNTDPLKASDLIASVQAETRDLSLPEIKSICSEVQRQLLTSKEALFVISVDDLPTLGEARIRLTTWLWKQAIQRANCDTNKAAEILGVSPTYVNKLGNRILKGLPHDALDKTQCGNRRNRVWRLQTISALESKSSPGNTTPEEDGE